LEAESAARRAEEKREEESRTPRELTPHECEWGCKFTGSFDEVVRHEATCKLKVNNVHACIPFRITFIHAYVGYCQVPFPRNLEGCIKALLIEPFLFMSLNMAIVNMQATRSSCVAL